MSSGIDERDNIDIEFDVDIDDERRRACRHAVAARQRSAIVFAEVDTRSVVFCLCFALRFFLKKKKKKKNRMFR
jgi:hypothetical protein